MSTFSFPKPVEDIEEPVLLEEDWYLCEIAGKPEKRTNRAETGQNLVIPIRLTGNNVEGANGRRYTLYPPWPSDADESQYDGRGMKLSDAKIQRIAGIVEGFGGVVDGTDIMLEEGMQGYVRIVQAMDQAGENIVNNVDLFSGVKNPQAVEVATDSTPFDV